MTLQQPKSMSTSSDVNIRRTPIFCHKCGNPIVFSKEIIAPSGRNIPLQPNTNGEPHVKFCMHPDLKYNRHTDDLITGFLPQVPRKKVVS